jgi:hypothetical protein
MSLTPSVNINLRSTTVIPYNIEASVTSIQILAANPERKGVSIWNHSAANLFIELGAKVALTAFAVKLTPGSYYELPFGYMGRISGVWDAANGFALIREFV